MSNLAYWIWFASLRELRAQTRRALLEQFGGAKEIFFADKKQLETVQGIRDTELKILLKRELDGAEAVLRRCAELDISVITAQDAAYPERLRNIPEPPSVLYVKGRLPTVDLEAVVAVVGTRKCTPYGEKNARNIGYELAAGGAVVCTGLAAGIDSRAAEGALMAGGTVIGVLGVAINKVYPAWNGPLYDDVAAAGALISEYPPDAAGSSAWFPQRNRIMAGLSVCTVVVEAPLRSGALITAHRALDYGRDVFAVPGNVDAPDSRGCNRLLKEGATPIERGRDVLLEYASRFPEKLRAGGQSIPNAMAAPEKNREAERESASGRNSAGERAQVKKKERGFFKLRAQNRNPEKTPPLERQLEGLNETQLKIVSVMNRANMHVDDIVDLSRLPAASVLSELTMLQIRGFVTQSAGKRFSLNIQNK